MVKAALAEGRALTVTNLAHRFSEDVKWMTGRKPNFYWQMTWRFISPLLMLIIFVAYVAFQTQTQPVYGAWNPNYVCYRYANKR